MSDYSGMIIEQVVELATLMTTKADVTEELIAAVTTKLGSTKWDGQDRTAFESEWTGTTSKNLTEAARLLREAGEKAKKQAEEQRTASSS